MAILTRKEIKERLDNGDIRITPEIDRFQLQPHAIDLRLGETFLIPRNWKMDEKGRCAMKVSIDDVEMHREQFDEVHLKPGQYFELLPNEFVIASSMEKIEMNAPDLMAILFPRTSTNRRGINLSLSGIIDCGYKGGLIFPMKNEAGDQVLRVYPGERVCQIILQHLASPLSREEADQHGVHSAKYSGAGAIYKLDKDEEREALISGKLNELKKKYRV